MANDLLLKLNSVGVRLGSSVLLENVSCELHAKKILTIIGPNGGGKTTLLRLILGLMQPSEGSVTRTPGLTIGYMPQKIHFDPLMPLTVEEFLGLAKAPKSAMKLWLAEVGMHGYEGEMMQNLSGGELQRILLARAVMTSPKLLVLDEPTQGVDVAGQNDMYKILLSVRDKLDCGIVLVSHDLHVVMAQTDEVLCLNQHVCCQGKPDRVGQHPAYQALLNGTLSDTNLALYEHRHDHAHDLKSVEGSAHD